MKEIIRSARDTNERIELNRVPKVRELITQPSIKYM